ncbi:MAG: YciI family protein [Gammaproteobacteria bacterium]
MKYLLLVYSNEQDWSEQDHADCMTESIQLCQDLHRNGQYLGASPLQPVATATSIKVREGRRLITDGPFAETHEQLGGYFLVETDHLDEAIAIAGRIPAAKKGTVEIRPLLEVQGLPDV